MKRVFFKRILYCGIAAIIVFSACNREETSKKMRTTSSEQQVSEQPVASLSSKKAASPSTYFAIPGTIQAEDYVYMNGIQTENCSEGGLNVGWIDPGDWMVYNVNVANSGKYTVSYRVASLNGGGSLKLEKGGGSVAYGTLSVPKTSGWQNWVTISHTVTLTAGQQQIAIAVPAGGWNINYFSFVYQGSGGGTETWYRANLTNFTSYPDPGSEECIEYNGCLWAGYFAFVDGKQTESWVQSHNIAAVHSKDANKYKLKTLRLRQGTKQIDVVVYDMCSDTDCGGCCTENANANGIGFLIDIEKYTMQRFGSGSGIVEWRCLDCQ